MPTLPVSYTSVNDVLTLVPKIGSASTITSAHVYAHAGLAEALINGKLARRFTIPPTDTGSVPPLLAAIAADLTAYRVLGMRVFIQEKQNKSEWPDRYKEALETLKALESGEMELLAVDNSVIAPRTDLMECWSNNMGYTSTFNEASFEASIQDEDKIDDIVDARDS